MKYSLIWFSFLTLCSAKCIDLDNDSHNYHLISQTIEYNVSTHVITRRLNHFWESTGFCPPDPHDKAHEYMLSRDMTQNLAFVGSLPHNGIKRIRVHYLLKLISLEKRLDKIQYNFTFLDNFLHNLNEYKLKPGFELMGNPFNSFTDFENKTQIYEWKDLIQQLVVRYINIFGKPLVKEWYFESWNEPSIEFSFKRNYTNDNIRVTPKGFLNYYDACSLALKEVDDSLMFGGPGDHWPKDITNGPFVIDLMKHCINGTNYLTGNKSDIKLDYISLHEKGNKGQSGYIDQLEHRALTDIANEFSRLKNIPFVENEGDPEAGWNLNRTWRADNRYAATVVQVLARHVYQYNYTNKLLLYGFDNGFLSFYPFQFTQRTLLARFQMNNTKPFFTQFIRKPGYVVMGLLSKLGDHLIDFSSNVTTNSTLNAIATAFMGSEDRPTDYSIVFVNSLDTITSNINSVIKLNINSEFNASDDWKWSQYVMNNTITNPYNIWHQNHCPDYPSDQLFDQMRAQEEPYIEVNAEPLKTSKPIFKHQLNIGFPGISLIIICRKTNSFPKKLKSLKAIEIKKTSILLTWFSSSVRCLKTYEIQYSKSGSNESFVRINRRDIIFPLFQYSIEDKSNQTIDGYYRIRAIDFWDRKSEYSESLKWTGSS